MKLFGKFDLFYVFLSGLVLFPIALTAIWYKNQEYKNRKCQEYDLVVDVGGCNSYGVCGVRTMNRYFLEEAYPVRGKKVCVRY